MPSKVDGLSINNPKHDRRVKLTESQKESIRAEYEQGDTSYNKLAVKYGVSKRLIQFIIKPEKLKVAKEQYKERRKDGRYYDREKHTNCMKAYRNHKKKLLEDGIIKKESD